MSSTCCSSGKARVYFNIPTQGGLKYKINGKWKTIPVDEPLTSTCNFISKTGGQTGIPYKVYFHVDSINGGSYDYYQIYEGEIGGIDAYDPNNWVKIQTGKGSELVYAPSSDPTFWYDGFIGNSSIRYVANGGIKITNIVRVDGQQDESIKQKYKFTVTGTETETKYLEIEVDECPDVQTIPCKFDPAKEQFIDVEMIPYTELPIPLPNYPIFQDCIEITRVGNFTVVEKVTKRNYGPKGDSDPTVRETKTILLVLDSAENCPPPQVRVECCPKGICGEDKKCPKGTTCELICNGFKCCYSKGVLIRSIKL